VRVVDTHRYGTGHVVLRTHVETSQTELVLVPADGTEALWLTRTPNRREEPPATGEPELVLVPTDGGRCG
jgi:hypothetical protein